MKNLLIYINPSLSFDQESQDLTKVQIERSLYLGWNKEDIMLVTNFDWEYNGIKSIVIDSGFYNKHDKANKIWAIVELFKRGMIKNNMFFHDFDAFQMQQNLEYPFSEYDLCFPDYGIKKNFNTGIVFFKPSSKDIFFDLKAFMERNQQKNEEVALKELFVDAKYKNRYKVLDISYNLGIRKTEHKYKMAKKPIKICHFHPYARGSWVYEMFKGNNKLNKNFLDENLIGLIDKHCFDSN